MALIVGLVGGWLTAVTGGIASASWVTPSRGSRSSCRTGHAGQTKPRGREVEEIEKRRRVPEGWRVIGTRESVSRER